jgi:hypothetical protein
VLPVSGIRSCFVFTAARILIIIRSHYVYCFQDVKHFIKLDICNNDMQFSINVMHKTNQVIRLLL